MLKIRQSPSNQLHTFRPIAEWLEVPEGFPYNQETWTRWHTTLMNNLPADAQLKVDTYTSKGLWDFTVRGAFRATGEHGFQASRTIDHKNKTMRFAQNDVAPWARGHAHGIGNMLACMSAAIEIGIGY